MRLGFSIHRTCGFVFEVTWSSIIFWFPPAVCVLYVCVALTGLVYVVCVLQAVQLCWGRGEESSVLQQRELLQRSARGLL